LFGTDAGNLYVTSYERTKRMIEMAQFHNIKFLKEVEGLSQRQIATKLGISRNTVSKYLKNNTAPTTVLRKKNLMKSLF
jgi:DNA-binding transcriptional regulator LsrR (DeoR family)